MSVSPVVIGDVNSVMQLPVAGINNVADWTQDDSDVIGHFCQVAAQISSSKWRQSPASITKNGDEVVAADLPSFEDFVFVSVYFRQLTLAGDDLLNDAVDRYIRHSACATKTSWIAHERQRFNNALNNRAQPFAPDNATVKELFDAFLYGAFLAHSIRKAKPENRARLARIYENTPKDKYLLALHVSLHQLSGHACNIVCAMYKDYAHWLNNLGVAKPNILWHTGLFKLEVPKG
jgi:hypothetical protein